MTISLAQLESIKAEAEGKSVNVFLSGDVTISGYLVEIGNDYIKIDSDSMTSYFTLDMVIAIQIFK